MSQRWRFFFSTKLRKWRKVHFAGMCVCVCVFVCLCVPLWVGVLCLWAVTGLIFPDYKHPALCSKALLTRTSVVTFLVASYCSPPGLQQQMYGPALQLNTFDRLLLVQQLYAVHTAARPHTHLLSVWVICQRWNIVPLSMVSIKANLDQWLPNRVVGLIQDDCIRLVWYRVQLLFSWDIAACTYIHVLKDGNLLCTLTWMLLLRYWHSLPCDSPLFSGVRIWLLVHHLPLTLWGYFRN